MACVWILLITLLPAQADPLETVRNLYASGRFAAALEKLESLQDRQPQAYALNRLDFLRARLLTEAGKRDEARALLKTLVAQESPLQDHAFVMLLENLEKAPLQEQQTFLSSFLDRFPTHPVWAKTALHYAHLLKESERLDEALVWYDRVWKLKQGSLSRQAALEHARMHLLRDDPGEAARDLQRLIQKSEKDDVALSAANDLHRLQPLSGSSETDIRRRTRVFMNNRRTQRTRDYLSYLIRHYPKSQSAPQYHYLQARTHVLDGNLSQALDAYRQVYARYPDSDWGIYCKYQAGNTALRLRDYEGAAKQYQEFLATHSSSRHSQKSYLNLADSQRWLGRDELAETTVRTALQRVSASARPQFHYYLARLSVEQREYQNGLEHLNPLLDLSSRRLPSGVTREEIYYLQGLCYQALDKPQLAEDAFLVSAQGKPNYFSGLSRQQIPAGAMSAPSRSTDWLSRLIGPHPFLWEAPSSQAAVQASPLGKARHLLLLGLEAEASMEIKRAGSKAFDHVDDFLFNLSYYSARGRLPRQSLLAAERLQRSRFSGVTPDRLPAPVRRLIYPRHFWEMVSESAAEYSLDPHLLLAVIHQESRFDPSAKSYASARGLMQFMLGTARQLSDEIGLPAPQASDLYRPEVSIRLGAHYLHKLIVRHGNSVERALAAYNAGSGNVDRWSAKADRTHPPALFVSNIGFRETKLYVVKVLGNYHSYRLIYPSSTPPARQPATQE